jgi:hypothetical protein
VTSARRTDHSSRREIDLAIGALIAMHRCTEREAFASMVRAVDATGIGLGELSRALIAVISGTEASADAPACRYWATVVHDRGGAQGDRKNSAADDRGIA